METKIDNLIKKIKKIKMTPEEKTAIFFKVETFISNNPIKQKNKFQISPYFSKNNFIKITKIFSTGMLLMVLGVGGLSYSSASALPGNLLYPIKVNVKEKIEEKLVFTPEKKVELGKKRIETRFTEVESLIKNKKITSEDLIKIESKVKIEKEKIEEKLNEIEEKNPEKINDKKEDLENKIKEHQEKITQLIKENTEETSEENLNKEENLISQEEVSLETKEKESLLNKEEINPEAKEGESLLNKEEINPEAKEGLLINDSKIIPFTTDIPTNKIN